MSKTKALIVKQIELTTQQSNTLSAPTPAQFIRKKPGRGGKSVSYVEGGYVTNQLNKVFGPMNWSFEVTERGETQRINEKNAEGEVWVYGKLTIHDHQRGYTVSKGQYGQHPVHKNVPMGDALKAAETDALKKCASLFGIALDVYWGQLDTDANHQGPKNDPMMGDDKPTTKKPAKNEPTIFERSKNFINQTSDRQILAQSIQRIENTDALTYAEKYQLKKLIEKKLKV